MALPGQLIICIVTAIARMDHVHMDNIDNDAEGPVSSGFTNLCVASMSVAVYDSYDKAWVLEH